MTSCETAANAPTLIVTTAASELHELGALLAATIAALEGWQIRYLGPNLPPDDLALAATQAGAQAVAVSALMLDKAAVLSYFKALARQLPEKVVIFAGGAAVEKLKVPGARVFPALREFRTELAVVRASAG